MGGSHTRSRRSIWRRTDNRGSKKKWFDLKFETKKNVAKCRREIQQTGGGTSETRNLSEMDQRIGAIIGETALSGS